MKRFFAALLLCLPLSLQAAMTVHGTATGSGAGNTTVTITWGSAPQNGDVCVVNAVVNDSNASGNLQVSGYTEVGTAVVSSSLEIRSFAKTCNAGEGNPGITMTVSDVNDSIVGIAFILRGAETTIASLVGEDTGQANSASQTTVLYPARTIGGDGRYVCIVGMYRAAWTSATIASPPAGFTEQADLFTTAGSDASMDVWCGLQTTASNIASGQIDITGGPSSTGNGAKVISFKPAGCTSSPTITDVDTDEVVTGSQANVTITGTGFCASQGTGSVQWRDDGAPCTQAWSVDTWSDTSIQVDVTYGSCRCGSGNVRVTNDGGNSDDQAITVDVTPAITDVDTDETLTATQTNFSIAGTGFCAQGAGTLTLRDASANSKTLNVDSWSDTAIQGDVSGVGAGVTNGLKYGSLDIRVTNNDSGLDDQAITVNVPSGTTSTDLSGGIVALEWDEYGNPNRLYGYPLDLQTASQVAIRNIQGSGSVAVNADGSIVADSTVTAFDYDFSRDGLFLGSVGTWNVTGPPPTLSGLTIPDQVYAVGVEIIPYDLDNYFTLGDAALSGYALMQLSAPSAVDQVNGAVTASTTLVVDDWTGIAAGTWIKCGSAGYSRVKYVDPFSDTLGLWYPITCADNDAVSTMTVGAASISGLSIDGTSHEYGGTPDTELNTTLLIFRLTDAAGLTADTP